MDAYLIDPLGEYAPVPASELRARVREIRAEGCSLEIAIDYAVDDMRQFYRIDEDRLPSVAAFLRRAA